MRSFFFFHLSAVGAHAAPSLCDHQCHLRVYEHAQDIRALPTTAVCDVHTGHTADVPVHGRDDRQDAHQRDSKGNSQNIFITSSISYIHLFPVPTVFLSSVSQGSAGAYPTSHWASVGYTLDESPVHCRTTQSLFALIFTLIDNCKFLNGFSSWLKLGDSLRTHADTGSTCKPIEPLSLMLWAAAVTSAPPCCPKALLLL